MKITYDKEADAAYVYLKYPIEDGDAKKTIRVTDSIILDFGKDGKLIGIEVLSASKVLGRKVLLEAEQIAEPA